MILDIVQIGNSQGIRIPKSILEECGINKKIDLEVKNNTITIKPVEIRKGWEEAFKECGVDTSFYANRLRSYDEILPWSHLDYMVSHDFFVRENKKAHESKTTRNCREGCSGCGVSKNCGGVYCG